MTVFAEDAAWNAALASRFYREEFANRPVFLCVDEETLAAIGRDEGLAGDDAVQVLARAVRPRVRESGPLDAWTQDALAWRRSGYEGPPPFLSVLAMTVLAATMLGGRDDHAYYSRLNDLLGLPGHGMPRYFDSDIQQLWLCLNEWLTEVQRGRRGLPTATNATSRQPNVGWALSQTVLRPSDRAKLPLLFSALNLHPGQQVDGRLLVDSLRRSGLAGHGLSRRLTQVLDDPALVDSLATTLAGELAAWDGTLRDESGRRALQLALTYHQRSRDFGLAVHTPSDLAHHGVKVGSQVLVSLGKAGELQPVSLPVTAELLDGTSLLCQLLALGNPAAAAPGELRLVMAHANVHLLTPSDRLARWVEVRPAELHRRYLVVVRSELAAQAVEVMRLHSQDAPRRTSVPCPVGWMAYEYKPVRTGTPTGPLPVLCPCGTEIVALEGGLPILARSRLYLTAGPPDVVFDHVASDTPLEIDGKALDETDSSGRLRLVGRNLANGRHELNIGGARLTVRLVDEYAVGPSVGALGVVLRIETSPAGRPWIIPTSRGAQSLEAVDREGRTTDVIVRGATVGLSKRATDHIGREVGVVAQARAGGRHYALGAGPFAFRVFPRAPRWLLELQPRPVPHLVDLASCAADLPFAPTWFLRVAGNRASVVCASPSSPPLQAQRSSQFVNEWDEVLPWLGRATAAPGQADAWNAWLGSLAAPNAARVAHEL